ncbi:hypothetical protein E4T43_05197 [Aureobasidium subglaciale]|nr:hypothetical protein E4T43_05197 [Aureobasidium subglaciale]
MSFHNASGYTFLALLIGSPHIRIYLATLGVYFALSPIPSFSSVPSLHFSTSPPQHTYVEESKVAYNCQPTGIHEFRIEITMLREMSIYLWLHNSSLDTQSDPFETDHRSCKMRVYLPTRCHSLAD